MPRRHLYQEPAERALREQGMAPYPTPKRRLLLGCLACQYAKGCGVSENMVARCTNLAPGQVHAFLKAWLGSGLLQAKKENITGLPEPEGTYIYRLAETPAAAGLAASLETPAYCQLEEMVKPAASSEES